VITEDNLLRNKIINSINTYLNLVLKIGIETDTKIRKRAQSLNLDLDQIIIDLVTEFPNGLTSRRTQMKV